MSDEIKAGDILVSRWGYGQTNVDWYRVKERIGKSTIIIVQIPGIRFHPDRPETKVTYGDMSCHSKPDIAHADTGEPMRRRLNKYNGVTIIRDVSYAHKWDGEPVRESWGY